MQKYTNPPLCRYCRRFLGSTGIHGICKKCWELYEVPVNVMHKENITALNRMTLKELLTWHVNRLIADGSPVIVEQLPQEATETKLLDCGTKDGSHHWVTRVLVNTQVIFTRCAYCGLVKGTKD